MSDTAAPARTDRTALTAAEQETVDRARQLLERTHYDPPGEGDPRLADARSVAHGTLELAAALEAERSSRLALKARCDEQQAILGQRAYEAIRA